MSPRASARAVAVAAVLAIALPAAARAPKIPAAASEHVAAANRAFQAKSYDRALAELRAAYRLAPRPEFLPSFAQVYRAAGQLQQALEACNSYLATMPNGALASSARQLADKLRAEIEAAAPAPPSPPAATPPPTVATPPPAATPPPTVLTPLDSVATPAPPSPRSRRRKILGWTIGAGVVGVGLAVGLGVGLTIGRERASTFGRVDFTPLP